jgi:hypothetical protein
MTSMPEIRKSEMYTERLLGAWLKRHKLQIPKLQPSKVEEKYQQNC